MQEKNALGVQASLCSANSISAVAFELTQAGKIRILAVGAQRRQREARLQGRDADEQGMGIDANLFYTVFVSLESP
jgi:hypothetical protein